MIMGTTTYDITIRVVVEDGDYVEEERSATESALLSLASVMAVQGEDGLYDDGNPDTGVFVADTAVTVRSISRVTWEADHEA
jgi:hypothetical protein